MMFGRDPFGFKCEKPGEEKGPRLLPPPPPVVVTPAAAREKDKVELRSNFNSLWQYLHELFVMIKENFKTWEKQMSLTLSSISVCHEQMLDRIEKEYDFIKDQISNGCSSNSTFTVQSSLNPVPNFKVTRNDAVIKQQKQNDFSFDTSENLNSWVKKEEDDEKDEDDSMDWTRFYNDPLPLPSQINEDINNNNQDDNQFGDHAMNMNSNKTSNQENQNSYQAGDNNTCRTCGLSFASFNRLTTHIGKAHSDNEFKCEICQFTTNERYRYTFHKHVVHEGRPDNICPVCDKISFGRSDNVRHLKFVHDEDGLYKKPPKPRLEEANSENHDWKCKKCAYTTDEQHKFLFHKHVFHEEKSDKECPICEQVFTARSQAVKHLKFVHDDEAIYMHTKDYRLDPPPEFIQETFNCPEESCQYKTTKREKLERHVKDAEKRNGHENRRDILCEECPYKTDSKSHLKQHVRFYHQKIFDYKCKFCYFCAIAPVKLRKHVMALHDVLRNEKCHLCPGKFSSSYYLQQHIKLVHEKVRLFHCDKCVYKCNKRKYLAEHLIKKHANE